MSGSTSSVSGASSGGMGYKIRNFAAYMARPQIEINLKGPEGRPASWINTYSTMDKIEGTVTVTCQTEIRFDDVEILFEGVSKTYVEKMSTAAAMTGRTEARHRFLKLEQPVSESSFPQPRVIEAHRTYAFPFTFVVPPELLPTSCSHNAKALVEKAHLKLPPSMGDKDIAGIGSTLLDDLSPEMAKIDYAIRARVMKYRETGSRTSVDSLGERQRKVRIIPVAEEQPPLDVDPSDEEYKMRKEKPIKKKMFGKKLGNLVIEAQQPKPIRLPALDSYATAEDMAPLTTVMNLMLRFDPSEESTQPPCLGDLSSRIKISTFYASHSVRDFPSRAKLMIDIGAGMHQETLNLSSRCVASAQWQRHNSSNSLHRRLSNTSTSSVGALTPAPSSGYKNSTFYTAEILVPITLPKNKVFLPTFHSCLISRIYSLDLSLSVHGAVGTAGMGSSLSLRVPVQIASSPSSEAEAERRISDALTAANATREAEREMQEMMQPRLVTPLNEELRERSTLRGLDAPPGYELFATGPATAPAVGVFG